MVKMLVYGTLRTGLINNDIYLKDYDRTAIYRIKGFDMYDLGGYPMIHRNKDGGTIVVEEYDVSDEVYNSIRRMECGAGYVEASMILTGEEYKIYCYSWVPHDTTKVKDGDYVQYVVKKYGKV